MIKSKEKNFVSAVVYTYNNESDISNFLEKLSNVLYQNFEKYEIICVNDDSEDNTVNAIKEIDSLANNCILTLVNMSFYQGIEAAMNAGIDVAIGDFVFEFDSIYMDYDPQLIIDIYYKALSGYDIVSASTGKKIFVSNIFYKLYNGFSGTQNKLASESFRVLSRRAINRVHGMSKTLPYRKALYANCGLKFMTMMYMPLYDKSIVHSSRQFQNRQETALNTLILFTNIAYRVSIWFTFIMMIATFGTAIYALAIFLLQKPVPGFTPLMLVLTGSFFGVFAVLAIVIKYLSVLVDLTFIRQRYLVEGIEKIR